MSGPPPALRKDGWKIPTWVMLHSIGDHMPEQLSDEHLECFRNLVFLLGVLLPCAHCREHMASELKRPETLRAIYAVRTGTHAGRLLRWLHNRVNWRLKKRIYTEDEGRRAQELLRSIDWARCAHSKLSSERLHARSSGVPDVPAASQAQGPSASRLLWPLLVLVLAAVAFGLVLGFGLARPAAPEPPRPVPSLLAHPPTTTTTTLLSEPSSCVSDS